MSNTENKKQKTGSNLNFLLIVGLLGSILAIIFAVQNAEETNIEFFTLNLFIPKALLIICSLAVGSLLSILFGLPGWWRKRRVIKGYKHEIKALKEQLVEKNKPADKTTGL